MFRVVFATLIRNHRIALRAFPWDFMLGRLTGGLYTVGFSYFVYHYVFRGHLDAKFASYAGSSDYLTFTILGAGLYTFAIAILMNVGRSLMTELREGTLETLLLSSASRTAYFLGNAVEQISRSLIELAVIILVGWLLGANVFGVNAGQLAIVLFISIIGFFSMGVALATVMLYLRDTYLTQNTLFMLMNLLCGVAFPIQYLPSWLQPVSHVLPLTPALSLFRATVIAGDTVGQHLELVIQVLCLSILYFGVGISRLARVERRLIETTFG